MLRVGGERGEEGGGGGGGGGEEGGGLEIWEKGKEGGRGRGREEKEGGERERGNRRREREKEGGWGYLHGKDQLRYQLLKKNIWSLVPSTRCDLSVCTGVHKHDENYDQLLDINSHTVNKFIIPSISFTPLCQCIQYNGFGCKKSVPVESSFTEGSGPTPA